MGQLIHVQFYRLKKHPLGALLIPACFLTALLPVLWAFYKTKAFPTGNGYFSTLTQMGYFVLFCALVMIPLTYCVCDSFASRTITYELTGGYSLHQILFSRLIVGAGIALLASVLSIALVCGGLTLLRGWESVGTIRSGTEYLTYALVLLWMIIQASVICVLSSCIARESTSALSITWMLYFFGYLAEAVTWPALCQALSISDYSNARIDYLLMALLPGLSANLFEQTALDDTAPYINLIDYMPAILISGTILMIVFYSLAYVLLKKIELKSEA